MASGTAPFVLTVAADGSYTITGDEPAAGDGNIALAVDRMAMLAIDTASFTQCDLTAEGEQGRFEWIADVSGALLGSAIASSAVDAGAETITSVAHGLTTGQAVVVTSAVNGLSTNTIYYVIRVSADTFRLASSLANAIAGTAFDLTGTAATTVKKHHDPLRGIYVPPTADISGASGAWRRVANGARYDIRWFGAAVDGATDDKAAVMQAAKCAVGLTGGGTIWFPAGITLVGGAILFGWNDVSLTFEGAGMGCSFIKASGTSYNIFDFSGAYSEVAVTYGGLQWRNLTIDGNAKTCNGIKLKNRVNVLIQFCEIKYCVQGLWTADDASTNAVNLLNVRDNRFIFCTTDILLQRAHGTKIQDNQLVSTSESLLVYDSDSVTSRGNTYNGSWDDSGAYAVWVAGSSGFHSIDDYFEGAPNGTGYIVIASTRKGGGAANSMYGATIENALCGGVAYGVVQSLVPGLVVIGGVYASTTAAVRLLNGATQFRIGPLVKIGGGAVTSFETAGNAANGTVVGWT